MLLENFEERAAEHWLLGFMWGCVTSVAVFTVARMVVVGLYWFGESARID